MPWLSAHSLTGGGVSERPRPFFSSGIVTTRDGVSPTEASSSKTVTASWGVPKKAKRSSLFFFLFVIDMGRFVGVENALQVVQFMLEDMREESGSTAREEHPSLIVGANGRFFRARYRAPFAADRKTSLMFGAFCARYLQQLRID